MNFRRSARPVAAAAATPAATGSTPLTSLTTQLRDELEKGAA